MTRILFVSLFTMTLTMTALSQTQNQPENAPVCSLSLSQAPVIRGIRLGMKPDEWLKLFPGSAQDEKVKAILDRPAKYPDYGLSSVTFLPASSQNQFNYLPREEFSGVNGVSLTLFDNQIIAFGISYAPYPGIDNPWDSVEQLIPIFSETFNLPQLSAWDKSRSKAELKCAGFDLILTAGSRPTAYLTSKYDYIQIFRQRAEADKQKGRAAFKP
ncbi:MAG TPA: hypothetical protein VKG02_06355 [Blastocatellia bacterium]|nr:hypothetical protein [Blastocatellia bacterium]